MNRDPEDIQRHLLRLLQDLFPTASPTDIAAASQALGSQAIGQTSGSPTDLQATPDTAAQPSNCSGSDFSFEPDPAFNFGDVPAVQDRFHALLKHRLQSEIQQNPPLFPWESEVQDYESSTNPAVAEPVFSAVQRLKSPLQVWIRQLSALQLPVAVPEVVLAQLLEQCQQVAQSSLREGSKLVKAVEEFFPEQAQSLNYLAGLVMTAPARSGAMTAQPPTSENFPKSYDAAIPAQQMVLTLLAAREILSALTLTVSPQQPVVERPWATDLGPLLLQVRYEVRDRAATLRAQVTCPCGGSVTLQQAGVESTARRSTAGSIGVELPEVTPTQVGVLTINLADQAEPLTFTIQMAQD